MECIDQGWIVALRLPSERQHRGIAAIVPTSIAGPGRIV
jgi:hypothetical protein